MTTPQADDRIAAALRDAPAIAMPSTAAQLAARFAARLSAAAAHPERVPIRINGARIEARTGATLLSAAMKSDVRLMHLCGARKLCSTCRVTVEAGNEHLSPMSFQERLSLRGHLALGSRTRLACQARLNGPAEVQSLFPLCGDLPGEKQCAMARSLGMKITSIAIAIYVSLAEYALIGAPIALVLWLLGAGAARLASAALGFGAVWAAAIVMVTHVRPLSVRTRTKEYGRDK